jgi:hypothetical protein
MASDSEMEDFARECVDLANLTADPQMRERLFQMAREWMEIAMHPSENARAEIDARIPPANRGGYHRLRPAFRAEGRGSLARRQQGSVPDPLIMTYPLSVLRPVAPISHNVLQCEVSFL